MKTQETKDMEHTLYVTCREANALVVEEVTLPNALGIVDTLSLASDQTVTCYELKITKNDFHSKAKLSFIGHDNYFVLPAALVPQVIDEVPDKVGVLVFHYFDPAALPARLPIPGYFSLLKKPVRQPLGCDFNELMTCFGRSLNREVDKAKRLVTGLNHYSSTKLLDELTKRQQQGRFDDLTQNAYNRFFADNQQQAITDLTTEVSALKAQICQQQKEIWNLRQHQPKLPLGAPTNV